jgi:DNA-directed RNA polymerase specialized sigma24 family protein
MPKMSNYDQTSMGGEREAFLTTHWSLIEDVKQHKDKDRALIGLLLKRYWKPVYCYLRRKGHDNEHAKDFTQGFLHEVVLNRHLVERADSSKGRFRSFLLHALNQYLLDERRKETARRHIPKNKLVPLEIAELPELPKMVCKLDAEQSFDYIWKAELLERALAEVKDRYIKRGMEKHWYVFQDSLLSPTLENRDRPSLSKICQQYKIDNEATISNMLNTVKKLIRSVLKSQVQQTVVSEKVAEEELKEIFKFLEKKGKN